MSKNDGGPAFPRAYDALSFQKKENDGMTLRDYFAGKALQAALNAASGWSPVDFNKDIDVEALAKFSYKAADAMLAERDK